MSNYIKVIIWVIIGAVPVSIIIGLVLYAFVPETHPGQVVAISWMTTTNLQQRTKHHEGEWGHPSWKDVVPGSEECRLKYSGYKPKIVLCISESQQDCDIWCEYDYWKWTVIKTLENSGRDSNPVWLEIAAGQDQRVGKEAKFIVGFKLEEVGQVEYSPKTLDEYIKFVVGAYWKVKTNKVGMVRPVCSVTAELRT